MNIGVSIKHCREQRNLSQKTLAEISGVSVSHLCLIENGKRDPSISTIKTLSEALNIPVNVLIFLSSDLDEISDISKINIDRLSSLINKLISQSAN